MVIDGGLSTSGSVRASDADRERVVAAVRRHYAAGRLETQELEQRVAEAYAARWRSELRWLLSDMPLELPAMDRSRMAGRIDRFQRALLHLHLVCWVIFNTLVLAVWAWGGANGALPLVALVPTTALLAWHAKGSRNVSRRLAPGAGSRMPSRRLLA